MNGAENKLSLGAHNYHLPNNAFYTESWENVHVLLCRRANNVSRVRVRVRVRLSSKTRDLEK